MPRRFAVTSTLFLFYVESRLTAPEAAGPLLLPIFHIGSAGGTSGGHFWLNGLV